MRTTGLRRLRRWGLRHCASLLLLPLLAGPELPAFAAAATSAGDSGQALRCEPAKFRAVIDVGHTSDAGGALSARGIFEYEFNLRLAKQIVAKLVDMGFAKTSLLVVSGKGRATLFARTARANAINADLLLSVHHDSVQDLYLERWTFNGKQQLFSDKYRGYSIFVSRRNPSWDGSIAFAKMLADNLKSRGMAFTRHHAENLEGERRELIEPDRGVYRYDDLVVLRSTRAPAVLFEAGVIVNRDEEALLSSASYQARVSEAVAAAIQAFCGAAM